MASCPSSTPALKPSSANARVPAGSSSSPSTPAKPKPWIKPKPNATSQLLSPNIGRRLFSATSTTDAAMTDSTKREGSRTTSSAARLRVME